MIYDWGVHLIDQILFMMPDAKIKSVYADIKNVLHEEVDDYFKIILKMDNGVTAHIELSTYILKYQPRWLAAGDKGHHDCRGFRLQWQHLPYRKVVGKTSSTDY